MMILNQDHYVQEVIYGAGPRTLTREKVGTRYVIVGIRTLVVRGDAGHPVACRLEARVFAHGSRL